MKKGALLVISGPSGAGKSTVCRQAAARGDIYLSVSATTRAKRPGESAADYTFLSKEAFERLIKEDAFLEYANVHGNYYGTLKAPVYENLENGRSVFLEIDVQGGEQVKAQYEDTIRVFVLPPSKEALKERLLGRRTETTAEFEKRMKNAVDEIARSKRYDYLVINDTVEETVQTLLALTRAGEKRVKYYFDFIDTFLKEEGQDD